jgi:PAS domain S-box-containing protein
MNQRMNISKQKITSAKSKSHSNSKRLSTGGQKKTPKKISMPKNISGGKTGMNKNEPFIEKSDLLFRLNPAAIVLIRLNDKKYAEVNEASLKITGFTREDVIGKTSDDLKIFANSNEKEKAFQELQKLGRIENYELKIRRKDGIILDGIFSAEIIEKNGEQYILAIMIDLTSRKLSEKAQRESEEKYRTILDSTEESYYEIDLAGNLTFFNDSTCSLLGYSREELMGMNNRQYTDKETAKKVFLAFNRVYRTGEPTKELDWQIIRKDGTRRYIEQSASLQKDSSGKPIGFRGIIHDITERKQAEERLRHSEENFRHSLDNSPLGVRIVAEKGETIYANKAVLEIYGYDSFEKLRNAALQQHYTPESYANFQLRKEKRLQGETGPSEYDISIMKKNGDVRHVHVFRKEIFWNGQKQSQVIYHDITERKKAEDKLNKTLETLRRSIRTTIQVLGVASEARDPYTAGHQRRVADLARAIATEMKLPQEIIEGIRMAGAIHDIGKISIPSEILCKPIVLTDLEFSLVKAHSQYSYDIMKDVESPWPLADIVYQHHERVNGSGYPRGLKDEDILIEARILAVADVVEAILSYRPYRPALGLEIALSEIENNAGIFYDHAVAKACLKLFREKGFKFE